MTSNLNTTVKSGKKRILAVDDRPSNTRLVKLCLEQTNDYVAAAFRANPKLKDVPIVFLTATITKGEVVASGGEVGGNFFLAKPVVLKEMVACLKHHLGE